MFSATFDKHPQRLKAVLQAIRSAGLTLKPEKCHFCFEKLQFLGHVVIYAGVHPDLAKIAAVAQFPISHDKKAVRRFLGFCAYSRWFIADFTRIASPLTHLTRDYVSFLWGDAQQTAFNELRKRLQTSPVFAPVDKAAPTTLHTDASNVGLGAVLVLLQDDAERVIAYGKQSALAHRSNLTRQLRRNALLWYGRL